MQKRRQHAIEQHAEMKSHGKTAATCNMIASLVAHLHQGRVGVGVEAGLSEGQQGWQAQRGRQWPGGPQKLHQGEAEADPHQGGAGAGPLARSLMARGAVTPAAQILSNVTAQHSIVYDQSDCSFTVLLYCKNLYAHSC